MAEPAPSPDLIAPMVVFLGATSLVVPLLKRAKLSAVLGFIVIGVLIGPYGFGRLGEEAPWLAALTITEDAQVSLLAELGVAFLLFIIGLEVSSERIWALRRWFGLGVAQIVLTAALIAAIAIAWGNDTTAATVIGLAFAISSTAVVLQLMGERRMLGGAVGRAGFSVLLAQDVAVVPILFLVTALGAGGGAGGLEALGASALKAALAIVCIFVGGKLLLRPLFRWVTATQSREVFLAAALLVVIAAAWGAASLGLSMALGAFLAGLLLAETEFRHQIETDLDPFKGLLLGLFFVTIGMQIDPLTVLAEPARVLIGLVGLFLVKAAVLIPLARAFGLSWPQSVELGLLLGQTGEFAFVIVALGASLGAISPDVADYMLLIVALSILFTPAVADLGARLRKRLDPDEKPGPDLELAQSAGHVVVAGYGRVGQAIGAMLADQEIGHVALETDASLVKALRDRGWPVHFGDAGRPEMLEAVGAPNAAAIVVTMDDAAAVERVVQAVRVSWPNVAVFARARDAEQARRMHAAGARFAVPETIEATLQLGEALLNGLGLPDEAARRIIDERRDAAIAALRASRP